jgi:beta-phosphoglucomutase
MRRFILEKEVNRRMNTVCGALLFDVDGTLVDNMPAHLKAWVKYLKFFGITDSDEQIFINISGKTTKEVLNYYFGNELTPQQVKDRSYEKETLYKQIYLPEMCEISGLTSLLNQARNLGVPMAIGSAGGIDNIKFVINNLKIADYFDVVISGGDVKHGKPDPEIFLKAASKLGVEPQKCLVFEDSLAGLEGAYNAGMKAVAITTGHPAEELDCLSSVIKVVDDFRDLDLESLLQKLPC